MSSQCKVWDQQTPRHNQEVKVRSYESKSDWTNLAPVMAQFKKNSIITVHPEETMNLYAMSSQSTQLRLNSTLYQRGRPAGGTRIKFILWGLWTILPIVVWAKKCRHYWTQRGHRIRLRGILGGETTGLTNSLRFILRGPGTICTRYHRDSQSLR